MSEVKQVSSLHIWDIAERFTEQKKSGKRMTVEDFFQVTVSVSKQILKSYSLEQLKEVQEESTRLSKEDVALSEKVKSFEAVVILAAMGIGNEIFSLKQQALKTENIHNFLVSNDPDSALTEARSLRQDYKPSGYRLIVEYFLQLKNIKKAYETLKEMPADNERSSLQKEAFNRCMKQGMKAVQKEFSKNLPPGEALEAARKRLEELVLKLPDGEEKLNRFHEVRDRAVARDPRSATKATEGDIWEAKQSTSEERADKFIEDAYKKSEISRKEFASLSLDQAKEHLKKYNLRLEGMNLRLEQLLKISSHSPEIHNLTNAKYDLLSEIFILEKIISMKNGGVEKRKG